MRLFLASGGVAVCILLSWPSTAQDLLTTLRSEDVPDPVYATSTFKSTRVINSHSVETLSEGNLDFRISHRFGKLNSGAYNLFGLDEATIRIGLAYGLTDRITVGLGRSSFEKTFDGYLKAKIIRQRKSKDGSFPFTITWFSNMAINTLRTNDEITAMKRDYRYSFAHQLIIGRKFNHALSLQIAPTMVHRNLADAGANNDLFALEGGGRVKLSNRVSINVDYIYRLLDGRNDNDAYANSLSLGVDIETGGHVFQLHITNSQGMIEEMFVDRTTGTWKNGDLFYGFNISRQFVLKRKR